MAAKKKKRAGGRPSLYKPEHCDALIEHMRGGKSYETFAATIGVGISTIYSWEQLHAEFLEAKEIGVALSLLWWERVGLAAATGQVLKNDKGETVINGPKVNTAIWIFTMKCRFPKLYREALVLDASDAALPMLAYERKRDKPKKTA